ncbi:50S ribosomal protein L11 methyltransferase [Asticcacaulis sp. AC460]|uniref:class I SAM-dependent methyltransferase n=1 Tax=Asticcacaulis sp. AC460 TaxID=1282360 RepID=UPI0003C3BFFB|nr:50S ribosomal protein L11 methyltransferase [Asticcacaulis sp. AC460]ESQ85485.1 50S ribosomal protein L11 methyltransferase [Asticcacaulis sp. AC460]
MTGEDRRAFIAAHTRPLPVPSLPHIRLYQADEVTPLWLMTEADMVRDRLSPPFWAFAWSGGQALARYIFDHPHVVQERRVLDLACGSGLVGIAAALNGAQTVACNDIDPYAQTAVAMNAGLNGVQLDFIAGDLLSGDPPPVEVVLAGDIAYEAPMTQAMLTFLRRALAQGCEVWVGDPHRTYFPAEGFERCARYDIATNPDIEDSAVKPASVWRMIP